MKETTQKILDLPPCPEGWKHKDGGTWRKPKMGESFINAGSLDPKIHPEGIKPFAMHMTPHTRLDHDVPTEERWIIEPT